jgi:hypothetical protein
VRRALGRALTLLGLLAAAPAAAADPWEEEARGGERLAGTGRVSVLGGWRVAPNGTLLRRAAAAGAPLGGRSPGGPALQASFAYAPSELLDLVIDLFASGERLWQAPPEPTTGLTYGAMVGLRAQWLTGPVGPFRGLQPALGLHTGPTLLVAVDPDGTAVETAVQGWAASAGLTGRLPGRWALSLEYRFLLARGMTLERGSFSGGGNWLLLGLTYTFPPSGRPETSF